MWRKQLYGSTIIRSNNCIECEGEYGGVGNGDRHGPELKIINERISIFNRGKDWSKRKCMANIYNEGVETQVHELCIGGTFYV